MKVLASIDKYNFIVSIGLNELTDLTGNNDIKVGLELDVSGLYHYIHYIKDMKSTIDKDISLLRHQASKLEEVKKHFSLGV